MADFVDTQEGADRPAAPGQRPPDAGADGGPDDRPGAAATRSIGRYQIERVVGEGGMSVVYAAFDPELRRRVAIKVLRPGAIRHAARLRREAQALARLSHDHVITVYDVGEVDGQVFIAMELLDGGTLGTWMEQPHPWRDVVARFVQAGRGLAAAHAAGLVHRDFKPHNVLLRDDGRAVVTDFGLVRALDDAEPDHGDRPVDPADRRGRDDGEGDRDRATAVCDRDRDGATEARDGGRDGGGATATAGTGGDDDRRPGGAAERLTGTGTIMGTPAYMAPEQLRGREADARSDQFSYCVALHEALYGARPFAPIDGLSAPLGLAMAVQRGEVIAPPADRRVPGWLRALVVRGLRVAPGARHPSMEALLTALERGLHRRRTRALITAGVIAAAAAAVAPVVAARLAGSETGPARAPGPTGAAGMAATGDAGAALADWVAPPPTGTVAERARALLERHEASAARALLEPAVAAHPDDVELELLLVRAMLRQTARGDALDRIAAIRRDHAARLSPVQSLLLDGAEARARSDGPAAAEPDRRAFAARPDLATGARLVEDLAWAGRFGEAEAALAAVRALPGVAVDHPMLASLDGWIADNRGDHRAAADAYTRAAEAAAARGWPVAVASALEQRSWMRTFLGDFRGAIADGREALRRLTAAGEHLRTAAVQIAIALPSVYAGDYGQALDMAERAVDVARAGGNLPTAVMGSAARSIALVLRGDTAAALTEIEAVRRQTDGDSYGASVVDLYQGMAELRLGRVADARRSLARLSRGDADPMRSLTEWNLGQAAWMAGDTDAARAHLERCEELGTRMYQPFAVAVCRVELTEVQAGVWPPDQAVAVARQVVADCDRMGARDYAARARLVLARALRRRAASATGDGPRAADDDGADAVLAEAATRAGVTEDPLLRLQVALDRAVAARDRDALLAVERDARAADYLAVAIVAGLAVADLDGGEPADAAARTRRATLLAEADRLGLSPTWWRARLAPEPSR